jgi:hypothetical protein
MMMSIQNKLQSLIKTKNLDDFTNYYEIHKTHNLSMYEDELFFEAIECKKIDIANYIYNTKKNKELLCNIECLLINAIKNNDFEIFKYLLEIKQKHEKKFSYDIYLIHSIDYSNEIINYLLELNDLYIENYLLVYNYLIRFEDKQKILDFRNKHNSVLENNLINYTNFYQEEFINNIICFVIKHKDIDYIKNQISYLILSSSNELVKQEIINNIITNFLIVKQENINIDIFKYFISILNKEYLDNYIGSYIISTMYQENVEILEYLFTLNIYQKYSFIYNLEIKNEHDYKNNIEYIIFEFGEKIFNYFYDYLINNIQTYSIFLKVIKNRKLYVLKHIQLQSIIINPNEIKNIILLSLFGTTVFSTKNDMNLNMKSICIKDNNFQIVSYLIEKYNFFKDDDIFLFKNMIVEFINLNKENINYYVEILKNKKISNKKRNELNKLMYFFVENIILQNYLNNKNYELLNYLQDKLYFIDFKKIDKIRKNMIEHNLSNVNASYINEYIQYNLDKEDTINIIYEYILCNNNLDNFYKLCFIENKNIELKNINLIKEYIKNNVSLDKIIFNSYDKEFIQYLISNDFIELKYNEINNNIIFDILLKGDIEKIKICMLLPEINDKIINTLEDESNNENCNILFGELLKNDLIDNLNFFVEHKKDLKLKKFTLMIIKNIYNNNNFYLLKTNYYNLESKNNNKILISFLITIMKKCIVNTNYEMFLWCFTKLDEKNGIINNQQLTEICNNMIEKWFKYSDNIESKIEIIHKMIQFFDDNDKLLLTNNLVKKLIDNNYFIKILDFKEIIINLFSEEDKKELLDSIIEKTELNYIIFYMNEIYKEHINFENINIKNLLIGYTKEKIDYFKNNIEDFILKIDNDVLYQVINELNYMYIEKDTLINLFEILYELNNEYFKDKFDNTIFKTCCYYGNKDCVEFILNVNKNINISENNEEAFKNACDNGQLNMVKYLLNKNINIDISNNDEEAMFNACSSGHLNVAKFLYKIKPSINLSVKEDYLFSEACNNGNLNIAKWLYSILGNNICNIAKYEHSICGSCFYGHIEVAQWLFTVFNDIDITVDNDYCFINACKNDFVDLCIWIRSLLPERYNFIINNEEYIIETYNINKILVITETKENENVEECFICIDNTCNVISSCNHQYCFTCIEKLYKMSTCLACPYCRTENITLYNMIEN